jgi:hypothetical protein
VVDIGREIAFDYAACDAKAIPRVTDANTVRVGSDPVFSGTLSCLRELRSALVTVVGRRAILRESHAAIQQNVADLDKQISFHRNRIVELRCDEKTGSANPAGGSAGKPPSPSTGNRPLQVALTLEGATVVTDVVKRHQEPGPNDASVIRHLQSGRTFGGSVEVRNGPLPAGWTVTVWHPTGSNVLLTTTTGGSFTGVTQPKGFGAGTGIGAYVCEHFPDRCSAQANISIQWIP